MVIIDVPSGGRNPHAPTDESRAQVAAMVACGLDDIQIAFVLKCDPREVREHYKMEMEHGRALTNAQVGAALLRAAIKGSVDAQKFWLERRAGWVAPKALPPEEEGEQEKAKKVRRQLMDDIVSLVASDKLVQEMGQTAAQANPGAKRMQ